MPSVITDKALTALGIEIPEYAKNQNARIISIDNQQQKDAKFKCRCGRKYQWMASFILRCAEHTDARDLIEPFDSKEDIGEPLMSVKKVRKRIQVVESGKIQFECSECSVGFTERYKYNDHMECHTNPLLKCCSVCMTQFSSGIRARKHIAKFHPELHIQQEEERKKTKETYRKWNPPKYQKQLDKRKRRKVSSEEEEGGEDVKDVNIKLDPELELVEENDGVMQEGNDEIYEDVEHLDPDFLEDIEKEEVKIVEKHAAEPVKKSSTNRTKNYKVDRKTRRIIGENEYRMPSREQKECPICKVFTWPCNMKKHIMQHNAYEEETTCFKCGEQALKMRQHFKTKHQQTWLDVIKEKTREEHNEGILKLPHCGICFTPFNEEDHLRVHVDIVHGNQRNYQRTSTKCRVCHKVFYNATNRRLHEERMHNNEEIPVSKDQVICDICNATFQYKGHLVQHFKKHLTPRNYSEATKRKYFVAARDSTIKKVGTKKRYRSEFVRGPNDTVEMIYFCSMCEAQFKTKNDVQDHVKLIHPRGNRNIFICERCGFLTDAKYNLLIHLNTNHNMSIPELEKTKADRKATDTQPCTCRFCGQAFSSIIKCKTHEKYHEKVRDDIVCPICGVKLRTQAYLRDHLKRHQEKNIFCPYNGCDQKFVVRQNLQLHIKRMHLQAEIFKCRYCPNVYKSWNGRCYHEFKFHDGAKWRGHCKPEN